MKSQRKRPSGAPSSAPKRAVEPCHSVAFFWPGASPREYRNAASPAFTVSASSASASASAVSASFTASHLGAASTRACTSAEASKSARATASGWKFRSAAASASARLAVFSDSSMPTMASTSTMRPSTDCATEARRVASRVSGETVAAVLAAVVIWLDKLSESLNLISAASASFASRRASRFSLIFWYFGESSGTDGVAVSLATSLSNLSASCSRLALASAAMSGRLFFSA